MPLRADFPELSCFTLKLHPIQQPFQCSWDTNPCHRSYRRPRMSIKKLHYILLLLLLFKRFLLASHEHVALYCAKPSRLTLPIAGVTGICHRPVKESPLRTSLTATVSSELRFSVFPPQTPLSCCCQPKGWTLGQPPASRISFLSFPTQLCAFNYSTAAAYLFSSSGWQFTSRAALFGPGCLGGSGGGCKW